MTSWHAEARPAEVTISAAGWFRALLRGLVLGAVTYGCLVVLVLLRLLEQPLAGQRRPMTPYVTQFVCRAGLAILGISYQIRGTPMRHLGAVVANHASWLEIGRAHV